ncbi:MAG: chemotaxis protein CheW [Deltaproteobacteria bacterium]|nr:chemotaxis protein CheW [Deltaproteobacteria bacterium]
MMEGTSTKRVGTGAETLVLCVQSENNICAIPVRDISEIMRPMPREVLPDSPHFVIGMSVIRGRPVPVVDFSSLIGLKRSSQFGKYVVLNLESRKVALAVENVLGIKNLSLEFMEKLPPLLQNVHPDIISAIGTLDEDFLILIQTPKLVSIDAWEKICSNELEK